MWPRAFSIISSSTSPRNGSLIPVACHRQERTAEAGSAGLSERDADARRKGELTYEPDTGRYEASMDLSQVAAILGGRCAETPFGRCLIVDRRYEADRWHGGVRIGDCEVDDADALAILDPSLGGQARPSHHVRFRERSLSTSRPRV